MHSTFYSLSTYYIAPSFCISFTQLWLNTLGLYKHNGIFKHKSLLLTIEIVVWWEWTKEKLWSKFWKEVVSGPRVGISPHLNTSLVITNQSRGLLFEQKCLISYFYFHGELGQYPVLLCQTLLPWRSWPFVCSSGGVTPPCRLHPSETNGSPWHSVYWRITLNDKSFWYHARNESVYWRDTCWR